MIRISVSVLLSTLALGSTAKAETNEMEETIVIGTRASLMSAIDKQELADGLISVVDSDALGDFPDTTAAEAIRRLSGISIENDQGEGRYVTIRGMSSDLNSIAVNGATIVAPENDRSVLLDGVPTELLDSITVSKSLTPDQGADSIGGRIDFTTKNPSDLKETLLKVKIDTTYNDNTESASSPRFSVTYGDKLSDNTGHVLGLTYSEKEIVSYNNETGFSWDSDDYMDDDWEMRYYAITRERLGVTYEVDYAFADESRVYFNAFWNEYTDNELRWKDEYGKLDRTDFLNWSQPNHGVEILRKDTFAANSVALRLLCQMPLTPFIRDCRKRIIGIHISVQLLKLFLGAWIEVVGQHLSSARVAFSRVL